MQLNLYPLVLCYFPISLWYLFNAFQTCVVYQPTFCSGTITINSIQYNRRTWHTTNRMAFIQHWETSSTPLWGMSTILTSNANMYIFYDTLYYTSLHFIHEENYVTSPMSSYGTICLMSVILYVTEDTPKQAHGFPSSLLPNSLRYKRNEKSTISRNQYGTCKKW